MSNKIAITVYENPHGNKFPTQYGIVDFMEWCRLEISRMADHGRRVSVNTDKKTNKVALVGET